MAICGERLSRQLFTVLILNAVLVVLVPFGVWGGIWNSIVSLLIIVFFVYFFTVNPSSGLLKSGPSMGRRKRSPSAEGTRREGSLGASWTSPEKILGSERL